MSIAQTQADHLEKLATESISLVIKAFLRQTAQELRRLERENESLRADAARLDFLADPNNKLANVELPTHCVLANLHSLRAAIDMTMQMLEHETHER